MLKKLMLCISLSLFSCASYAQSTAEYADWIKKAMAFYDAKQYKESAEAFSHAFASNGWKGAPDDRYNAGCSWAQAGNKDSAFFQLNRIAEKGYYSDIGHLLVDADLVSLHNDARWKPLCGLVQQNKDKAEEGLDKPLVHTLDTIMQNDQKYRMQMEDIQKKYGMQSKEMKDLWKTITYYDSIDLIKVQAILDQYGWVGPDVVGAEGNETIFLVIQHSDLPIQDKYLPMMREAVKNNKAQPSALALLEDRVAIRHGKKQIYGSQIQSDENGKYFLSPLEDPDNVDKRRAEVGLGPLADYLSNWNMKWDVTEYKKELPEIEKKQKTY